MQNALPELLRAARQRADEKITRVATRRECVRLILEDL